MSLQSKIDELIDEPTGLGGLTTDRSMLNIALRMATEGGKRFRPWLFHATFEKLSAHTPAQERVSNDVLDAVAASLELLHTAFVIHDDVIDNDDVRRGHTSVPGWFRRAESAAGTNYPAAGAILTGDLALAAAVRGIALSGASRHTTAQLLDLLDSTLRDSAVGELADVRLSLPGSAPSLEDALSVAELKTAAYSFVLPMQAAALLAGAEADSVEKVRQIGRNLGIAFQLHDDLIGTFATAEQLGKDPDGDLREGKRTPLVVHAASTAHWRRIEPHLGNPDLNRADADRVRSALLDCGSVAFVECLLRDHVERARLSAEDLGLLDAVVGPLTASWRADFSTTYPGAGASTTTAGVA